MCEAQDVNQVNGGAGARFDESMATAEQWRALATAMADALRPHAAQAAQLQSQLRTALKPTLELLAAAEPTLRATAQVQQTAAQALRPLASAVAATKQAYGSDLIRLAHAFEPLGAQQALASQSDPQRLVRMAHMFQPALAALSEAQRAGQIQLVDDALRGQSASPLDAVGRLRDILRIVQAQSVTDDTIASIANRGPLGADFRAIRQNASRLATTFEQADPEDLRQVDLALLHAAEATHTHSDALLDQFDVIGLGSFGRQFRRSIGVVAAFTVGLGWVVLKTGEGTALQPTTFYEAAFSGASTYVGVTGWLNRTKQ